MMRPCLVCQEPTPGSYCPSHASAVAQRHGSAHARGYDATWTRLSARARRMQPFCTDCGATDELTTDHLPSAWERKAAGQVIRLADVAVVCGPCNSRRGSARPGTRRALSPVDNPVDNRPGRPSRRPTETAGETKFASQSGGFGGDAA